MEKVVGDVGWRCIDCGYIGNKKTHTREHVEAKHIPNHPGCICNFCNRLYKNRVTLRSHNCTHKFT